MNRPLKEVNMNKNYWDGHIFPILVGGLYNPILYNELFCANVRYNIRPSLNSFSVSGTGTIVCGAGGKTDELCIATDDRDVGKHCDIRISPCAFDECHGITMDIHVIGKKCRLTDRMQGEEYADTRKILERFAERCKAPKEKCRLVDARTLGEEYADPRRVLKQIEEHRKAQKEKLFNGENVDIPDGPDWTVYRPPFDEKTVEALRANVDDKEVEKFEIPMESDKPNYPTKFGEYQTYKFKVLCSGDQYGNYKEVFERELNSERIQCLLKTHRGIPIVDLTTHERRTKHLTILDTVWPSDSIGYVNAIHFHDDEFYDDARPLYVRGITDKFFQDMEDNNVRVTPVFLGVKDKPEEWILMYFTLLL